MNEPGLKCDYYKHLSKITLGFREFLHPLDLTTEEAANHSQINLRRKSPSLLIMDVSPTVPYSISAFYLL